MPMLLQIGVSKESREKFICFSYPAFGSASGNTLTVDGNAWMFSNDAIGIMALLGSPDHLSYPQTKADWKFLSTQGSETVYERVPLKCSSKYYFCILISFQTERTSLHP